MLSQVITVGRILKINEIDDTKVKVEIKVDRFNKNEKGEIPFDIIPAQVKGYLKDDLLKNCKENDLIGIKGRLETVDDKLIVISEKVTFLQSGKKENE